MARNNHSNRRRIAAGVGVATGAAVAAGMVGLVSAGAPSNTTADVALVTAPGSLDPAPPVDVPAGEAPYDTDGYQILFGSTDNNNLPDLQGEDNANLGSQLLARDPGDFTSFDESAAAFQANDEHPLEYIINFLDPKAYVDQVTDGIGGVDGSADGAYLVPADFFGYLGTLGDFFLLQPTGLGFLLDEVGELLFFSGDAFTF